MTATKKLPLRDEILEFTPYSAGLSIEEIREKYGLTRIVKLASNENPLGVSPLAKQAIEENIGMVFRYPKAGNGRLNRAIAETHGVPVSRVVAGNGSDEVIDLILRIKPRPGLDNVVAARPCFSMYELQARMCGIEFRQAPLRPDFSLPLDEMAALVDENTAVVFVTSPDNPSGLATPVAEIEAFARSLPPETLVVVDEAYIHFTDDPEAASCLRLMDELPNLAVLRTFSKAYGLAGLRLGFGVLPEWLADYALRTQIAFSVNWMAIEAGIAALRDRIFLEETVRVTAEGRDYLQAELAALGCEVVPSQANFIMFRPNFEKLDAYGVFEELLARGVIIRPLKSYLMPDWLRVSVGDMRENRYFIEQLAGVKGNG